MSNKQYLTEQQKLHALGARFYHGIRWTPEEGDSYTTTKPDLKLERIVKLTEDKVFTEFATNPGGLFEWDRRFFLADAEGDKRVHVPQWILDME